MTEARGKPRWLPHLWMLVAAACLFHPAPALAQQSGAVIAPDSVAGTGAAFHQWNNGLDEAADRLLRNSAPALARGEDRRTEDSASPALPDRWAADASAPLLRESSPGPSRALARVEALRPMMEPILRRQGVPGALAAVVLVESGGQSAALSSKGARGLWQLMPETARRYGLLVSGERDERLDPILSTRAAASYLHDLYAEFGDWRLALAAYNAGEQAVETAIGRAGSSSFAVLSRRHLLPDETLRYVPAVLRASVAFGPLEVERAKPAPPAREGSIVFASLSLEPAMQPGESR